MGAGVSVDEVTLDSELEKLLTASDDDLAKVADKLNRFMLDPTSIKDDERDSVRDALEFAHRLADHGYAVAWERYEADDRQGADDLLTETRRLEEDFTPDEPPSCNLSEGASAADLIELARRHGEALIKSLEAIVQEAGGEFLRGPRKKERRITEKVDCDFDGDVARVVDVERAMAIFDSLGDLSLAVSLLRAASRRGDITIRRCKDRFGKPFEKGYRDLQLNVELDGFVGELRLNLRRITEVKAKAHTFYEVERVLMAGEGRDALQHVVDVRRMEVQDAGQQKAFLEAKNAVSAAPDPTASEELRSALADMYASLSAGRTRDALMEEVDRHFRKSRLVSDGQLDRLKALMGKCTDKYRTLTDRWGYLMAIETTTTQEPIMQTVPFWYEELRRDHIAFNPYPGCDADEAYIWYLFVTAKWVDFKHQAIMQQLVRRFNYAIFPKDLDLDESLWPLPLVNGHAVGVKAQHCAGPIKGRTRSEDKIKNDYADRPPPVAASLLDISRSTVVFDDPYALAAFLAYVRTCLDVVRVKNKFSDLKEGGAPGKYRDVLVNWRVAGHICETQLALKDLSQIKKEMHKYYEIKRAEFFTEVVEPMFKQPLDVDGEALLEAEIAASAKKPK